MKPTVCEVSGFLTPKAGAPSVYWIPSYAGMAA
jgi:hypothetical protein